MTDTKKQCSSNLNITEIPEEDANRTNKQRYRLSKMKAINLHPEQAYREPENSDSKQLHEVRKGSKVRKGSMLRRVRV